MKADIKQRILAAANAGLSFTAHGIANQLGERTTSCLQAIEQLVWERRLSSIAGKENFYGNPTAIAELNGQFKKFLAENPYYKHQVV